jgi:hypothetical protein
MTIRIPDTAIQAAARELCQFQAHEHYVVKGETCGPSEDAAEATLTAALPLLGETTIQHGVQYTANRETFTVRCRGAQHAVSAARDMKLGQNQRAVSRSVITISGEWTEDTGE